MKRTTAGATEPVMTERVMELVRQEMPEIKRLIESKQSSLADCNVNPRAAVLDSMMGNSVEEMVSTIVRKELQEQLEKVTEQVTEQATERVTLTVLERFNSTLRLRHQKEEATGCGLLINYPLSFLHTAK
ncbi:hypothetical protein Ddye_026108 [Dipteronia dyeriana]|uniref:Uncharacterized protein n=1 Tax=Dipteronia dyeriana TaxID=168575 RepID=A0AAD9WQ63_9ROSI|nr:hypothetical protein Ddye_026108 [Dipteronia dyeriana]